MISRHLTSSEDKMFKRTKVVNSIIIILCLLGVMQVISGALSVRGVVADKDNFLASKNTANRLNSFTDAWIGLNQTRIALNRAMLRLQMSPDSSSLTDSLESTVEEGRQLLARSRLTFEYFNSLPVSKGVDLTSLYAMKEEYIAYAGVLDNALTLATQRQLNGILSLKIQNYQLVMQDRYSAWRTSILAVSDRGVSENRKIYNQMLWTTGSVIVLVIILIALSWAGLRRILIRPLHINMQQIRAISKGDLTHSISAEGTNEMSELAKCILEMQQALISTVTTVRKGSDSIYSGAGEISAGNNDLSSRTEQQAASLEQTAASMEQLTATVRLNADNARQAFQLAEDASGRAVQGGQVVNKVISTMEDITTSSGEMAAIINVIDGIAFQTNILALNAAVEAARAGEQGRGFAVVAGEVRSLSQRSALAAKDIKALIEKSVIRVENGSNLVRRAGETMSDIVSAVTRVSSIMGEITSASDEQSKGIEQVGVAVNEMDRVTQQNASLVEESAAAAAALEEQARVLIQSVDVFRLKDEPRNSAETFVPTVTPANKTKTTVKPAGEWVAY